MAEKLTPWFPGDVLPVREGLYKRELDRRYYFSRWNGRFWCAVGKTARIAAAKTQSSVWQSLPWCGLAQDPAKEAA